jgi:hypothetical protein
MSDDDAIVFCMRVDQHGVIPVRGSVIRTCRCGDNVWVAGSTFAMAQGHRMVPVCNRCVTEEEFRSMFPTAITPAMVAEFLQHRRDNPEQWA